MTSEQDKLAHAESLFNQGLEAYQRGQFPTARDAFATCLSECEELVAAGNTELRSEVPGTRMNLALCLYSQGDLKAARGVYETALFEYEHLIGQQKRTDLRPDLAKTRMNLANCLYSQGDLKAARGVYETALFEYEHLIGQQQRTDLKPELATTRMNLANCLSDLGDLKAARGVYETALFEYEHLIGQQQRTDLKPDLALTRLNLAICLQDSGHYSAAENQYQAAFTLLQGLQTLGQLFPDAIHIVRIIAEWFRHPQRPEGPDQQKAFEFAKQGLDWLDGLLSRISDAAKNVMLEQNLALFYLAVDLALALNQPMQAYRLLERSKSRVLIEQMLREMAEPGPQVDNHLRLAYRQLRAQLRQSVQSLDLNTHDVGQGETRFLAPSTSGREASPAQQAQAWQALEQLEQELDKVRRAIAEQDPAFAEAIQPQPLEELGSLLPAKGVAFAFEQRRDFLYLYPLTTEGVSMPLRIEITRQQLDERIQDFFKGVNSKNRLKRQRAVDEISAWLTAQLLPGLLKGEVIPTDSGQTGFEILLIPHQAWHLLPLHLIQLDGEPLGLRYTVRYIPSLQVLRLIHARQHSQAGTGCIIANPDGTLPHAQQECETIKNQYRPDDAYLCRQDATLNRVRQQIELAKHGHFSCHGYFAPNLHSGLKVADGHLEAKELFTRLRMPNPRLVVLSACETAQVQPTLGDEYMGLSASFLFAGTHNVLATQWRVDDASTRLLMEAFYQGLADGLSAQQALKQAQQQLRSLSDEQVKARLQIQSPLPSQPYKNAYYWGGFVLIGDGV
jgi:CHAT domain-containing protein